MGASLRDLYRGMMRRCYDKNDPAYQNYGGKGITVCEEWKDRDNFKKWAKENGYAFGQRLDRIDTSKGYSPSNCKFGTKSVKTSKRREKEERIAIKKNMKEVLDGQCISQTRLHSIYNSMLSRCYDQNNTNYENYGGRGIQVCQEWQTKYGLYKFVVWALENGYSDGLTIDRIDTDGNYCPENCRWATMKEQARNKRTTLYGIYKGQKTPLIEIAEKENISYNRLRKRIKDGMSIDEAIEDINNPKPKEKKAYYKKHDPNDIYTSSTHRINVSALARRENVNCVKLRTLIKCGIDPFKAVEMLKSSEQQ